MTQKSLLKTLDFLQSYVCIMIWRDKVNISEKINIHLQNTLAYYGTEVTLFAKEFHGKNSRFSTEQCMIVWTKQIKWKMTNIYKPS